MYICIESAGEVPRDKCSCRHFHLLTCDQITWLQKQTAPLEKPRGHSAHLLSFSYSLICFSSLKSLFLTELCDWASESLSPSAETRTVSQEKVTQSAAGVALFWSVREVSVFTHRSVGWWPRPWPRRRCLRSSRTCTASSGALLSSPGPTPPRSTRTLSAPLHQSCRHGTLWWVLHTSLTSLHLNVCFTFMHSRVCVNEQLQRSGPSARCRNTAEDGKKLQWKTGRVNEEMKEPDCSSSVGSVRRRFMFRLLLHVYLTRLWSSL